MIGPHDASGPTPHTRRRMLVQAVGLSAVAALGRADATRVSAQEATPTSPQARGDGSGCTAPLGTTIDVKNVEGAVIATLTVRTITDPFTGYTPAYPPPRGSRFILLAVTVANSGGNPLAFDPSRLFLQDADGFVIYPSSVDLGAEPAEPGLTYQDVPPATEVSGVIGYILVQGVMPIRAFYSPSSDRLILLADLA
jgi:hypothetical protein